MNFRYSPWFRYPRKAFKSLMVLLYPLVIRIWRVPKVMSIEETISRLINSNQSIIRFGDGEFLYILDKIDLPFQRYDSRLAALLVGVLQNTHPDILVGLPSGYHGMSNLNREGRLFWKSQITWIYPRLYRYLDKSKVYANASMTRLYFEIEDKQLSARYFQLVKGLWEKKELLIVEGAKSRLGVGNDLFENAKSVHRILAPAHNAFDKIDILVEETQRAENNKLVLVALGPAAKALVLALAARRIRAIDIGNIDIEYEWFLRGVKSKVKVPGKYTSEAVGGRVVEEISDEKYRNQILVNLE